MPSYIKSLSADIDLIEVWSYVSQNSFEAADSFLDRLEKTFELLSEQPLVGRARDELASGLRSLPVSNYLVFYRLGRDTIEIVRVLNAARDVEAIFRDS